VIDVVRVARRDQVAVDHNGHIVMPDAAVPLDDRSDHQFGILAGEMEPVMWRPSAIPERATRSEQASSDLLWSTP
jgi:hypothetical protein